MKEKLIYLCILLSSLLLSYSSNFIEYSTLREHWGVGTKLISMKWVNIIIMNYSPLIIILNNKINPIIFNWYIVLCIPDQLQTYVAKDDFNFLILLPLTSKGWDYKPYSQFMLCMWSNPGNCVREPLTHWTASPTLINSLNSMCSLHLLSKFWGYWFSGSCTF